VTFYWAQPYSGNSPITNYLIEYKPKLNLNANFSRESVSSDSLSAIIKGLHPKTTYLFMLISQNVIGQSEGCHSLVITTEEEAPSSPPRDIKAVGLSASSIQISWKRPVMSDSNGSILGYYVGYRLESDSEFSFKTIESHSNYHEKEETCQITELRKLTRYVIVVQAFNKKGAGPLSDKIQVQTLEYGKSKR
jgi:dscam